MKKLIFNFFTILSLLAIVFSFTIPSFAANSNVIFENQAEKFIFLPGSEYSDTDLFDNFKNMMPGDTRTQTVVVTNNYRTFDRIKVYLRAIPHGEDNPLSDIVSEYETLDSMKDFLSKLSMTVRANGRIIYSASPDKLDGLSSNVLLGTIAYGETVKLDVELSIPADLGSEYSNRMGKVDWIFTVEQVIDPIIIPAYTNATITAIKLLDGIAPKSNEFMFQLIDSFGNVVQTVNNNGVEVIFDSISYYVPGVYTYYIKEIPGVDNEINYDPNIYTVTVTVHNNLSFLNADVSYSINGLNYTGTPIFYNTTEEPSLEAISISIWAKKTLNQHLAIKGDFCFLLKDELGNTLQIKNNVGGYIFFERIVFDKPGVYTYYIMEQKGSEEGIIYDSSKFEVEITVIEKNGKLESMMSYKKNGLSYYETPIFENLTEDDPEIPGTSDSSVLMYAMMICIGFFVFSFVVIFKRKN